MDEALKGKGHEDQRIHLRSNFINHTNVFIDHAALILTFTYIFQQFHKARDMPLCVTATGNRLFFISTTTKNKLYTLPFQSLGSPRQFCVFHEKSHFYLSNELQNEYKI